MIGDGLHAGEPVTLLSFTPGKVLGRFTHPGDTGLEHPFLLVTSGDPPFVHYVCESEQTRVLPGHHPDIMGTIAEALSDAADFWEPGRCSYCADSPLPCEQCAGTSDEEKVRVYRALHEALITARPGPAPTTG